MRSEDDERDPLESEPVESGVDGLGSDLDDLESEPDLIHDEAELVYRGFTVDDDASRMAIGRVPGEDPHGDYGTGGGDVGIGGDVSPYGAMNELDARPDEVEAERRHDNPDYAKQGDTSEREEDLAIASADLRQQGEDEAWPEEDDLPSDVPNGDETVYPLQGIDDEDSPMMDVRDDDELDEGAA